MRIPKRKPPNFAKVFEKLRNTNIFLSLWWCCHYTFKAAFVKYGILHKYATEHIAIIHKAQRNTAGNYPSGVPYFAENPIKSRVLDMHLLCRRINLTTHEEHIGQKIITAMLLRFRMGLLLFYLPFYVGNCRWADCCIRFCQRWLSALCFCHSPLLRRPLEYQ